MFVLNGAFGLYLTTLTSTHDFFYFIVFLNIPCLSCLWIAFTHDPKYRIDEIRHRQRVSFSMLTVLQIMMGAFGASTSDLNATITNVIVMVGVHVVVFTTYVQKCLMYTIVTLNLIVSVLGFGLMGAQTDYTRVYSDGYCMNSMDCLEENFEPDKLSLVCDPAYPAKTLPGYTFGNISAFNRPIDALNISRTDLPDHIVDWFGNVDPSCAFVHQKWMWPYKQVFYLLCFYTCMMIISSGQNMSERESFYQIYSANKEKFQVKRALQKALESQQFSDEQFDMIKECVLKKELGSDDPLFDLHIDRQYLQVGKVLGRGAQGVVLKGSYKGSAVAVKTLINISRKELTTFRSEIALTKSLVHPNIVKLIGITVTKDLLGCILEFIGNGTMEDVLEKSRRDKERSGPFNWPDQKYTLMEGTGEGRRSEGGGGRSELPDVR